VRLIQTVLVPQGAEWQAVRRGLREIAEPPLVVTIPAGAIAVTQSLHQWQQTGQFVGVKTLLVMGLCGSLTPKLPVGSAVLYQDCYSASDLPIACDRRLTQTLHQRLGGRVTLVSALTCDRVICRATEKHHLAQQFPVQVVDMEGVEILKALTDSGIAVAMLRVVSDDSQQDLPDLTDVIGREGNLKPLPLAIALIRRPIAAIHLIRGSLDSLKRLQKLTADIFRATDSGMT